MVKSWGFDWAESKSPKSIVRSAAIAQARSFITDILKYFIIDSHAPKSNLFLVFPLLVIESVFFVCLYLLIHRHFWRSVLLHHSRIWSTSKSASSLHILLAGMERITLSWACLICRLWKSRLRCMLLDPCLHARRPPKFCYDRVVGRL